jgi:hypothetical protein
MLNQARIPLQIDIGFGDIVTPSPELIEYPTILDDPAPKMKAYPRYTFIAEKLEATIKLGLANSRIKDFFDIWMLSKLFEYNGNILKKAIVNTFNRRRTALPQNIPFVFTSDFYEDDQKQKQWKAFIRKSKPILSVGDFSKIISDISIFIMPVLDAIINKNHLNGVWISESGWTFNK